MIRTSQQKTSALLCGRMAAFLCVGLIFVLAWGLLGAATDGVSAGEIRVGMGSDDAASVLLPASGPTTSLVLSGTAGNDGWFVSPVTVSFSVEGGTPSATTLYRLNAGAWLTYTEPFVVHDGQHLLAYLSVLDNGEREPTQTAKIRVDTLPPSSQISELPVYQEMPSFVVSWSGTDGGGSGLVTYDVQYKDGMASSWRDWLTNTTALSGNFAAAQRGHVYHLRVRARDVAGNVEPYPAGADTYTFVDSVVNGGFENGSFDGWTVTGQLSTSLTSALLVGGIGQWAATLGSPDYGDSITPTVALHVPTDTYASLAQEIRVPPLEDLPAPVLRLWYRIQTYDVVWSCSFPDQLYDSFDVVIADARGRELRLLRDGNYDCASYLAYYDEHHGVPPFTDIVRETLIDLSPYAGQTVTVQLRNRNGPDWYYNTWTYVDDVRVVNVPMLTHRVYLPVVLSSHSLSGPLPAATPTLRPSGERTWPVRR